MVVSILAVLIRGVLLFAFIRSMPLSLSCFALSEFLALWFTVDALTDGYVDESWLGFCVPILYDMTLLLRANHQPTVWFWSLLLMNGVVIWLRLWLFECCTVGAPVYRRVRSDGPYAYMRHPLATAEMLTACFFLLAFPTVWNAIVLPFVICGTIAAALCEEWFLLGCSVPYVRYCDEVQRRFLIV